MKSIQNIVKNNLKYMSLFLAIIMCFQLIKTINSESFMKNIINNQESNISSSQKLEKPEKSENFFCFWKIELCLSILAKCFLAFLFGGLISERKFLILGRV